MTLKTYYHPDAVFLESGEVLEGIEIAYCTFGKINSSKSNVVWVFHALTANQDPMNWWNGLFGEDDLFNPKDYFIICANTLGSCYGTTGPASKNLQEKHRGLNFPKITIRDIVKVHYILKRYLKIEGIQIAIGGSFGGFQAIEFAWENPDLEKLILIATSATESPWNIAIHEAQRQALRADLSHSGEKGLAAARAIGMLVYRTPDLFRLTQKRESGQTADFRAASYIRYQGQKLTQRFDKDTYFILTECLDTHDISRHRGDLKKALAGISAKTLLISVQEDLIVSKEDMKVMSAYIPRSEYKSISTPYGHDGFLIETKQISTLIRDFLDS